MRGRPVTVIYQDHQDHHHPVGLKKTGVQKRPHPVGGTGYHTDYPGIHGSADHDHKVQAPEKFQRLPISH